MRRAIPWETAKGETNAELVLAKIEVNSTAFRSTRPLRVVLIKLEEVHCLFEHAHS